MSQGSFCLSYNVLFSQRYGDEKILPIGKPRRLMLFLNPEANDGYACYLLAINLLRYVFCGYVWQFLPPKTVTIHMF